MDISKSIQELAAVANLANMQVEMAKSCQQNKIEVMVGRCADGTNAPEGGMAVEFGRTENMEKLVLIGGMIMNYAEVTKSKDVYFVAVTFKGCGKLPAKSRMMGCKVVG
jgi:hypothetical protein